MKSFSENTSINHWTEIKYIISKKYGNLEIYNKIKDILHDTLLSYDELKDIFPKINLIDKL